MPKRKLIVVSRERGDQSSIRALGSAGGEGPGEAFEEHPHAVKAIGNDLVRRGVKPREAARFAKGLADCRIGFIHHATEVDVYYRIVFTYFTRNNAPILPGLRVRDYEERKGMVGPEQFMATSPLAVGGDYFDGVYYVTQDKAPLNPKRFDGTKLVAL